MELEIFDVEHGACALLTADNHARVMVDCGQNALTGWKPGNCLRERNVRSIELLAITNYDEDHARGAPNLFDSVEVQALMRNASVAPDTIKKLKSEDGMGPGIDRLVQEMPRFNGSYSPMNPAPTFTGLERRVFCCDYPAFDDENNLSLVLFLKCHGVGVMFPGDIEKNGAFPELLKRSDFQQALRETNVYVAPHHGRENGCSQEALKYLTNVFYVVISDKGHQHDTQKTHPYYSGIAKGGHFRGATRRVLTTRNDGPISFSFSANGWSAR